MKAFLVVNGFLDSKKFDEIYGLLFEAFKKRKIDLEIKKNDEFIIDFENNSINFELPDFVLFWDKDILLAKLFENLKVKVFNNANSILLCDNKRLTALKLCENKVPIPKTIIAPKTFENVGYTKTDFIENVCKKLGLPLIIKEAYGSFGKQVYLAKSVEDAKNIVRNINGKEFLFQEYVGYKFGQDIRANVVGNKVICAIKRFNENDFRSNVSNGGKMEKISLDKEFEKIAIKAVRALQLDFAGVDILTNEDGKPLICEINSNPHFKSSLDCTGVNLAEYIADYVLGKVQKQGSNLVKKDD